MQPVFVEERNAGYERALVAVAAVWLFEVTTLSEPSVAQAEYAFRHAEVVGMKLVFYYVPFIGFQVLFMAFVLVLWA